jgi:hypothetical protein
MGDEFVHQFSCMFCVGGAVVVECLFVLLVWPEGIWDGQLVALQTP